jgi:hypothetical protein
MLAYSAGQGHLVNFEPAGHIYRLNETGEILPGVTTILKDTGISKDFDDLASMGSQKKHEIELKREIGTALHADTHAFDDDDIDLAKVNPLVAPYLDAWITFRGNYPQLKPAVRERLVYHPGYRFVGTLDGIFLLDHETEIEITERWSVRLTPSLKVPYRVTPYLDHYGDMEAFKSFATTWHHQIDRRAA